MSLHWKGIQKLIWPLRLHLHVGVWSLLILWIGVQVGNTSASCTRSLIIIRELKSIVTAKYMILTSLLCIHLLV